MEALNRLRGSWPVLWAALRRTPVVMWRDDVSDWAAALTYYAILALLPTLLMTFSLIGAVSPHLTDALIARVTAWAPAEAGTALHSTLSRLAGERSAALTVAVGGGASALWSASSYLAVFRRALHDQHGVADTRPALRTAHRILLTAMALLTLWFCSALLLVLGGPLVRELGQRGGLGEAGSTAWTLLRWPALVALVALLVLVLFRTGPPAARVLRHAVPGGVLAAALWLVSSVCFTAYAAGLGTYSRLYGPLAGVVVFPVWLWMTHLSLLAGAQFTAELARAERGAGSSKSPTPTHKE
ncbi:YihY/virulence factor BrkB family protein [Streptomyces hygroscopicus]|uniref:YihY/virulence factor BrkB family protein n=1 Tax=Streptomyces hygroscopicus TaxID=1912 RepID=UPI00223FA5E2|nr:YihY/virulence factor BrkB family protein [Streptomyces hygroscopicus]